MSQQISRKRKRADSCDGDILPPAKRRRLMIILSKRFLQKCKEWHERRRKIALGLILYLDAQMRDVRRLVRKRASSELYAEYEGLVKPKYSKLFHTEIPIATTKPLAPPATTTTLSSSIAAAVPEVPELEENATSEVLVAPAKKARRLIKRLQDNAELLEASDVKVIAVSHRKGWRRNGEKRI